MNIRIAMPSISSVLHVTTRNRVRTLKATSPRRVIGKGRANTLACGGERTQKDSLRAYETKGKRERHGDGRTGAAARLRTCPLNEVYIRLYLTYII